MCLFRVISEFRFYKYSISFKLLLYIKLQLLSFSPLLTLQGHQGNEMVQSQFIPLQSFSNKREGRNNKNIPVQGNIIR